MGIHEAQPAGGHGRARDVVAEVLQVLSLAIGDDERFLEDGRLEADNNTAENAIRPLAILDRNSWLFTGSQRGGPAAALYLGLIQSRKACDINPWAYLDDILRRILSHPDHLQDSPAPHACRGPEETPEASQ